VNGPGWPTGDGEVVGYAIAVDGWSCYLPIRHLGGGNLDERIVNQWLKKVFECPADKIMHNAQYDLGWIKQMGFTVNGRIIDTMIVASLLDENRFSYSLNALCYDLLNKTKSEKALVEAAREFGVDPKAEMWKMPAMYVGPYAEADAELTLELWNYFYVKIGQEDLWSIVNLELDLLPCLVDMTMRGVRVDVNRVERTRDNLLKREREVLKELKRVAGSGVEIWAAQSLAKSFDNLGIQYPKTEKGAPSFTKLFLQEHSHPVAKLIVEARNLNKTSGTFINSIMKHCHADGRIHSHINQLRSDDGGTVSGRISMRNPNLQQIPARDPIYGPMIRSLFLPEEGDKWAAIDFSQQEPRILVHYAHVYGKTRGIPLEGASDFVEAYNDKPETDFHSLVAEMANIPRKQAKTINLGLIYGMGVNKLSEQLDTSVEEAKSLVKQYHARVPFVKGLMTGVMHRLNDKSSGGALRSLEGRKCRFELWEPDTFAMNKALPYKDAVDAYGPTTRLKRAFTYKALNRLIQASAADMTKRAMVNLYKMGKLPMLQIHDELAMSVKNRAEAEEIARVMESAVPLEVPNVCNIEMGPSWGETK
jgi:DNA polymerase I-like protein with 3'-5' exonuclease and polymerase domains